MERIVELLRKLQEAEAERSVLIKKGVIRLTPTANADATPTDPGLRQLKKDLDSAQSD
jgi:hypothetical protein